jgi:hypothetical protein
MPARNETVRVALAPDAALEACRRALSPDVWELERDGADRLIAYEWPWRISCQVRPARLEVRVSTMGDHGSLIELEASAPGLGPAPARHLQNHLEGVTAGLNRFARSEVKGRR